MAMALIFGMNVIISLLSRIVAETILVTDMFGSQLSGGAPYSHLWLFANYLSAPNQDAGVFLLLLLAPFAIIGLFILLIVNWLRIGFSIVIILLSPIWIISLMADPSMRLFYTGLKTMLRLYLIPLTSLVVLLALFLIGRMLGIDASSGGDAVGAIVGMLMLIALAVIPIFLSKYVVAAPLGAIQGMITASLKAADESSLNRALASGMEAAHPGRAELDDPRFTGHDKQIAENTLNQQAGGAADLPPALTAGTEADAAKVAAAELAGDLADPASRGGAEQLGAGAAYPASPAGPYPGAPAAGDSGYSAGADGTMALGAGGAGTSGAGMSGAGGTAALGAGGAVPLIPYSGPQGQILLGDPEEFPALEAAPSARENDLVGRSEARALAARTGVEPWERPSRGRKLWSGASDLAQLGERAAQLGGRASGVSKAIGAIGEMAGELKKEAKDTLYAVDDTGKATGLLAQPGGVLGVLTGTAFVGGAKAGGTLDAWEKKYVSKDKPLDKIGGSRPVSALRARSLSAQKSDWSERDAVKASLREGWRASEQTYRATEQAVAANSEYQTARTTLTAGGRDKLYASMAALDERIASNELDPAMLAQFQARRAKTMAADAAWAEQYENLRGIVQAEEAKLAQARTAAQQAFVAYDAAKAAPPFLAMAAPRRAVEARLIERSEHKADERRFSRAVEIRDSLRAEVEQLEAHSAANDPRRQAAMTDLRTKLARTEKAVEVFSARASAAAMDAELANQRREERSQLIVGEISSARSRMATGEETARSLAFLGQKIDRDVRSGRLEPAAAARHQAKVQMAEQARLDAKQSLTQLTDELDRLNAR